MAGPVVSLRSTTGYFLASRWLAWKGPEDEIFTGGNTRFGACI
jgi:hypothetical protein